MLRWQGRRWAAAHNWEGGNPISEDMLVGCGGSCSSYIALWYVCSCMSLACSHQLDWERPIYLKPYFPWIPQWLFSNILTSFLHMCCLSDHDKSCLKHWSLQTQFSLLRSKTACKKFKTQCLPSLRKIGALIWGLYPEQSPFSWGLKLQEREE